MTPTIYQWVFSDSEFNGSYKLSSASCKLSAAESQTISCPIKYCTVKNDKEISGLIPWHWMSMDN